VNRLPLTALILRNCLSTGSLSLSVFLVSLGLTVCVVWLVALCGICGWCQRKLVSDFTSCTTRSVHYLKLTSFSV
ncbi:hypothetical protein PO909_024324, partial [Leuciscus waleckii]